MILATLIALKLFIASYLLTFVTESSTTCVSSFIVSPFALMFILRILFALLGSDAFVCLCPLECGSSNPSGSQEV